MWFVVTSLACDPVDGVASGAISVFPPFGSLYSWTDTSSLASGETFWTFLRIWLYIRLHQSRTTNSDEPLWRSPKMVMMQATEARISMMMMYIPRIGILPELAGIESFTMRRKRTRDVQTANPSSIRSETGNANMRNVRTVRMTQGVRITMLKNVTLLLMTTVCWVRRLAPPMLIPPMFSSVDVSLVIVHSVLFGVTSGRDVMIGTSCSMVPGYTQLEYQKWQVWLSKGNK